MSADSSLADYLSSLVQKTAEGKILWRKLNPSTIVYDAHPETGTIYLQKGTSAVKVYRFWILDAQKNTVLNVIKREPEVEAKLMTEIFRSIDTQKLRSGINVLDQILRKIG